VEVWLRTSLNPTLRVSGQHYAFAAISSGKEPPVPLAQEAGWAPEVVWTLWRREKYLAASRLEPRHLGNPARSLPMYRLSYPGSIYIYIYINTYMYIYTYRDF
jgi:hypothetical protein